MANRRKKKKKESLEDMFPSSPGWMLTYGDMTTQLLCFMILLLSFSTMDIQRFKGVIEALRGSLGVLKFTQYFESTGKIEPPIQIGHMPHEELAEKRPNVEIKRKVNMYKRLEDMKASLRRRGFQNQIEVEIVAGEIVITLKNDVLFASGEQDLRPEAYPILHEAAKILRQFPWDTRIEGNTDNIPLSGKLKTQLNSNWGLSAVRSISVLNYFIEKEALPPRRFSIVGHGEYRPVASNLTAKGRAQNRRVEIWVKLPEDSEGIASEASPFERWPEGKQEIPVDDQPPGGWQ